MVKSALSERGMQPTLVQAHTDSTKDYTSHVLAFQQAEVDGIIVWTDDQPAGLLAKQCKTLGAKFGVAVLAKALEQAKEISGLAIQEALKTLPPVQGSVTKKPQKRCREFPNVIPKMDRGAPTAYR